MKAEELMTGDLVYYCYANLFVTKVIDVCSHGEEHFIRCKRDEKDNLYKQDQLEDFHVGILRPIPLTPEILKKNGFVNSYIDVSLNKDSVYKYNHFYTGNSVIVDMESNKLIVKYENDIWMNLPYNRTIYVHELQHVLKHCEIKKEIII